MPSSCTVLPSPLTFFPEALAVDVVHSHRYIRSVPGVCFCSRSYKVTPHVQPHAHPQNMPAHSDTADSNGKMP